jgi:hypothetical protein
MKDACNPAADIVAAAWEGASPTTSGTATVNAASGGTVVVGVANGSVGVVLRTMPLCIGTSND